jgi:phospholipase/carboxylesterase
MTAPLSFIHRFESGIDGGRPLLLLHGTGGDENDLIPLARMVAPDAPLLSPRGKILENGMPRFFRRLAEGVFDEDDVRRRAEELADFIDDARTAYKMPKLPIALGYLNGANTAAAVLLLRPKTLAGAVLLRARLPLAQPAPVNLTDVTVLIASGVRDPMMSAEGATRLAGVLQHAGATVTHRSLPFGHELSQTDMSLAKQWLHSVATDRSP